MNVDAKTGIEPVAIGYEPIVLPLHYLAIVNLYLENYIRLNKYSINNERCQYFFRNYLHNPPLSCLILPQVFEALFQAS